MAAALAPWLSAHALDSDASQPTSGTSSPAALRPPATPTRVQVGLYLVELADVDPPSKAFPTFRAEFLLDVRFHDPRLARPAGDQEDLIFEGAVAEKTLQTMWFPSLNLVNEQGARQVDARSLTISPDGWLEYTERFEATLHAEVDLRRFPFDEQRFHALVEPFGWDEGHVILAPFAEREGFDDSVKTLEWNVRAVSSSVRSQAEVRSERKFSQLVFEIHLARESGYYLWKLVLPLLVIMGLTWSTFWMTGEAASTRMQRCFVAMLTVVAFYQVVSSNLPRISYLTFLDGVAFLAFGSAAFTLVHVIRLHRAFSRGDSEHAARLDARARWLVPGTLATLLAVLWFVYHG